MRALSFEEALRDLGARLLAAGGREILDALQRRSA